MKTWTLVWIIYSAAFVVFGLVCIATGNGNTLIHALCVIGQIVIGCFNVRRYVTLRARTISTTRA